MIINAILIRLAGLEKQTLGELMVYDAFGLICSCKTLELPWKWNQPNVSCIPDGCYVLKKRTSKKYGSHLKVETKSGCEVPGRSMILMHGGNYCRDTKGCILPGSRFEDIDNDGLVDVVNSRLTLEKIRNILPDETPFRIINLYDWQNKGET